MTEQSRLRRAPSKRPKGQAPAVADAASTIVSDWVLETGAGILHEVIVRQLHVWHRLDVSDGSDVPDGPCLVVTHHGFGGATDLNVFAAIAVMEERTGRPVKVLAHSRLWQVGLGRALESVGAVPASHDAALAALRRGSHVLVVPGGEHDAVKTWGERNTLTFHGHSGFIRLARNARVPILPVVTAGAGESLIVLSKGVGVARFIRRFSPRPDKVPPRWPVTLSVPWGLTAGLSLVLPYLPLPTKLDSAILPAVDPNAGLPDELLARNIETLMQGALTVLTTDRIPWVGRRG